MAQCTIKFVYSRGDKVWIPELKINGRVKSVWIGDAGVQYNVRYFHDGKADTVYFYEDELETLNGQKSKKTGFGGN